MRLTWKPLGVLLMLAVALSVTGCSTKPTPGTGTTCISFGPLSYSAQNDTPETVRGIQSHNAAWRAVCEDQ